MHAVTVGLQRCKITQKNINATVIIANCVNKDNCTQVKEYINRFIECTNYDKL